MAVYPEVRVNEPVNKASTPLFTGYNCLVRLHVNEMADGGWAKNGGHSDRAGAPAG